jgi:hypothetical protein
VRNPVTQAKADPALSVALRPAGTVAAPREAWPIHSMDRPRPVVVNPGTAGSPANRPSDAISLFDGTSLANWRSADSAGGEARWKVENGYMEVVRGTGSIATKQMFRDVHLHVEWATPAVVTANGQNRGNSGVFLMERYEVQVLDSWQNDTYPDGQAGAIYGQFPPAVNASRPPGEWQSHDIVFHAPRFDAAGRVTAPARMTVFHNGILVHDNVSLLGPTSHQRRDPYVAHPGRLSISLQDHGDPVRYRNIWVREIAP